MENPTITRRSFRDNSEYRAVSIDSTNTSGNKVNVIYSKTVRENSIVEHVEIYTGENYIVGAKNKSYSRAWQSIDAVPAMYKLAVESLAAFHKNVNWNNINIEKN